MLILGFNFLDFEDFIQFKSKICFPFSLYVIFVSLVASLITHWFAYIVMISCSKVCVSLIVITSFVIPLK